MASVVENQPVVPESDKPFWLAIVVMLALLALMFLGAASMWVMAAFFQDIYRNVMYALLLIFSNLIGIYTGIKVTSNYANVAMKAVLYARTEQNRKILGSEKVREE